MSLYVLQVVDTAIAQGSTSLEKGLPRERKSSKREGAAVIERWYSTLHTNAPLMPLLHDCKVAQVAIEGYRTGRPTF